MLWMLCVGAVAAEEAVVAFRVVLVAVEQDVADVVELEDSVVEQDVVSAVELEDSVADVE